MRLGQILMPVRAWWFLHIARNATVPPDVGQYLATLRDRNLSAIERIEQQRRATVDKRAAEGKTISTDAALKYLLEQRAIYDGPDRAQYASELDQFIDEFRKEHGAQIPVEEAYAIFKEMEARFGRIE